MSWVDGVSIFLDLLTLLVVVRAIREVRSSLYDARHERMDTNRRIEMLTRRVSKRGSAEGEKTGDGTAS